MAELAITIADRDAVAYIDLRNVSIQERAAGQGNALTCVAYIPASALQGSFFKPKPGQVLEMEVNDERVFKGPIITTTDSWVNPEVMQVELDAQDWTFFLNRRLVVKQEYPAQKAGERIRSILSEFLSGEGFWISEGDVENSLEVPAQGYDYEEASSVFDELAEATGYHWYPDFDKQIHFVPETDDASPLSASYDNILDLDSNTEIGDVVVTEDVSGLHNVVVIKDFQERSSYPRTDEWVADGEQTFFPLYIEPFSLDDVRVWVKKYGTDEWVEREVQQDPLDGSPESISGVPGRAYVCYAAGSLVATRRGILPVEEVEPGDEVIGSSGNWRRVAAVSRRWYDGVMTRLAWAGGLRELIVTSDHRVLVVPRDKVKTIFDRGDPNRPPRHCEIDPADAEWVPASAIRPGDYVMAPTEIGESKAPQLLPGLQLNFLAQAEADLMWLAGLYLAEGSIQRNAVSFSLNGEADQKIISELEEVMSRYFGASPRLDDRANSKAVVVRFHSWSAAGFLKQFGRGAANKRIPSWVFDLDKRSIAELIRGYWEGDGCLTKRSFSFKSISRELLVGISVLLLKCGVAGALYKCEGQCRVPWGAVYQDRSYKLQIGGEHATKLATILKVDLPPRTSRRRARTIQHGFAFYRVESKTDFIQPQWVFNLEVESDHALLVNGIICKNCLLNIGLRFPTRDLPEKGDTVKAEYHYVLEPRIFVIEDEDSQKEMSRRETHKENGQEQSTSGIHEVVVSVPDLHVSSLDPIEFFGELTLEREAWPLVSGSFTTFMSGWRAGQYFKITSANRDIFDIPTWVKSSGYPNDGTKDPMPVWVTSVTKTIVAQESGGYRIRYEVEFSSQPFAG